MDRKLVTQRMEIARPSPSWPAHDPNWWPLYRRDQGAKGISASGGDIKVLWPLSTSMSSCRAETTFSNCEDVGSPSSSNELAREGVPRIANASPTSRCGRQSLKAVSESPMSSLGWSLFLGSKSWREWSWPFGVVGWRASRALSHFSTYAPLSWNGSGGTGGSKSYGNAIGIGDTNE